MKSPIQCDRCGCSPCDCGKGIKERFKRGFQPVDWTPSDAANKLLALILRRTEPMPESLRYASVQEVEAFLAR